MCSLRVVPKSPSENGMASNGPRSRRNSHGLQRWRTSFTRRTSFKRWRRRSGELRTPSMGCRGTLSRIFTGRPGSSGNGCFRSSPAVRCTGVMRARVIIIGSGVSGDSGTRRARIYLSLSLLCVHFFGSASMTTSIARSLADRLAIARASPASPSPCPVAIPSAWASGLTLAGVSFTFSLSDGTVFGTMTEGVFVCSWFCSPLAESPSSLPGWLLRVRLPSPAV